MSLPETRTGVGMAGLLACWPAARLLAQEGYGIEPAPRRPRRLPRRRALPPTRSSARRGRQLARVPPPGVRAVEARAMAG